MSWNYRIIGHPEGHFSLHEVIYRDGRPAAFSEQPCGFYADAEEGPDGVRDALQMALNDATGRPVLYAADILATQQVLREALEAGQLDAPPSDPERA